MNQMLNLNKISQWYSRAAMSIPGFNVWELTVMFFVLVSGIRGIAGLSIAFLALGPFAIYWHIIMIAAPIIFMAGQFCKPPNGLVISILALILICVGSFAVYAGLAIAMASPLFTGFSTLLVFGFGSLFRITQMYFQLSKLLKSLASLRGNLNGTTV